MHTPSGDPAHPVAPAAAEDDAAEYAVATVEEDDDPESRIGEPTEYDLSADGQE